MAFTLLVCIPSFKWPNNKMLIGEKEGKIIIEGVTAEGRQFRPSDWAERISGRLASFKGQRIIYSPLLRPGIKNGNKCVILDKKLKETNPELFEHMLEFAKVNGLKICDSLDEIPQKDSK